MPPEKDVPLARRPDEVPKAASKDADSRAFEALFARHEGDARNWMAQYVPDENLRNEVLQAAKQDAAAKKQNAARKNVEYCITDYDFRALLQSRCLLILLRHFAEPRHHDEARVADLAQELAQCPGFAPRCSRDEMLLALQARHSAEAFNRLWEAHAKAIAGFLTIRMRNREAQGEVLHNTFLALRTRGIVLFDPTLANFQTFAKGYAEGFARRYLKGARELSLDSIMGWGDMGDDGPHANEPESRSPSPEEVVEYLEHVRALLRVTFSLDSPPHQLIVFGFNKLLDWMPRRIVATLFSLQLSISEQQLEKEYVQECPLESDDTLAAFDPLQRRLLLPFGVVITHHRVRKLYEGLSKRLTGEILLEELYLTEKEKAEEEKATRGEGQQPSGEALSAKEESTPEDVVAQWVGNVRKGVRKQMLSPAPV